MALNFPITPADGDTYQGYVYDATAGVWNSDPHQIASRFVTSATAPSSPLRGMAGLTLTLQRVMCTTTGYGYN